MKRPGVLGVIGSWSVSQRSCPCQKCSSMDKPAAGMGSAECTRCTWIRLAVKLQLADKQSQGLQQSGCDPKLIMRRHSSNVHLSLTCRNSVRTPCMVAVISKWLAASCVQQTCQGLRLLRRARSGWRGGVSICDRI